MAGSPRASGHSAEAAWVAEDVNAAAGGRPEWNILGYADELAEEWLGAAGAGKSRSKPSQAPQNPKPNTSPTQGNQNMDRAKS